MMRSVAGSRSLATMVSRCEVLISSGGAVAESVGECLLERGAGSVLGE